MPKQLPSPTEVARCDSLVEFWGANAAASLPHTTSPNCSLQNTFLIHILLVTVWLFCDLGFMYSHYRKVERR